MPDVIITQQTFDLLTYAQKKLFALQAYGVDNWQGYEEALREFYETNPEYDVV